ncbi:radical SAM enzyme [uncultured Clostridium sp.]|nr:radical SAM enzyme [uncultured Clostridium sp.]
MQTVVYDLDGALYINLTNRCDCACSFCVRRDHNGVGDHYLWLDHDPSTEEVMAALGQVNLEDYREVVFCGFGEPTYRLEQLKTVGAWLKAHGKRVRLNTNGHGDLINNRRIAPELVGAVDVISVSLNMDNAKDYQMTVNSRYGELAFDAMLSFAKDCAKQGIDTCLSVVDVIGEGRVANCRKLAAKVGLPLRVRAYIPPETPEHASGTPGEE